MSRKIAREDAYILTFEYLFNKNYNPVTLDLFFADSRLTDDDKKYINTTYEGIIVHFEEINNCIAENTENFNIDRIYKADLAALILAVYELKFRKGDIPTAVTISESIELSKKYSTEKSGGFVNGVLSKINKKLYGEKNENN